MATFGVRLNEKNSEGSSVACAEDRGVSGSPGRIARVLKRPGYPFHMECIQILGPLRNPRDATSVRELSNILSGNFAKDSFAR